MQVPRHEQERHEDNNHCYCRSEESKVANVEYEGEEQCFDTAQQDDAEESDAAPAEGGRVHERVARSCDSGKPSAVVRELAKPGTLIM